MTSAIGQSCGDSHAERGEIVRDDAEMQAELFVIPILRGAQHNALIFGAEAAAVEVKAQLFTFT